MLAQTILPQKWGPAFGAGVRSQKEAVFLIATFCMLGAGGHVVQTVGRDIMPVAVSLAEIITCSVIGFSCAHVGIEATARNNHVQTIYKLWPACPLLTAAASFGISSLTKALLHL
jgi:phosphate/sulfate permease